MSKQASWRQIVPPRAARRSKRLSRHGQTRIDDYYWLRQRDDPDVRRYLEAENAYADAVFAPHRGLHDELLTEMAARIVPDDSSVPYRDGDYFYYYRYEPGHEYPLYCRKHGDLNAAEELLLDVNKVASGHDYCAVRGFSVAPDHRKAVFGVDTEGRRFFTLQVVDFASGELLVDRIEKVTSNTEWAEDSETFYYTKQHPDTLRDYQVLSHRLGCSDDVLVYQEDDEAYWLGVEKSLSGKTLFLVSAATNSTEVRFFSAAQAVPKLQLFLARDDDHEYYVTDGGDRFFVLSNAGAKNFRVFETPLEQTPMEDWRECVPHRDSVLVDGIDVFSKYLVLSTVEAGLEQLEVVERHTGEQYRIDIDEAVYTAYTHDNYRYESDTLRFSYEALNVPESTYDYAFDTRTRRLLRQAPVAGGFSTQDYASERLQVSVRDGTEVPVSLVYRKSGPRRSAPLLIAAYGAYGLNFEPDFDSTILSLLDRGFVYAIAHVRGGSECGRQWYYDGRQRHKENTFNDFIDVTKHLIAAGYTAADRCYAAGGSAGGLLIGAVANRAPELYHGMIARVPFVDVLTTMLDESIPLTTGEYDEWGNPAARADYQCMAAYSPYDNVTAQSYPHLLVTTGLHDSQVQYWEPAKWIAKLRATAVGTPLMILKTDLGAGHSGKTGRYQSLEDTALEFVFLLMLEDERTA